MGVTDPIDPAQTFVLDPLRTVTGQPALTRALRQYAAGSTSQRNTWLAAYAKAIPHATG